MSAGATPGAVAGPKRFKIRPGTRSKGAIAAAVIKMKRIIRRVPEVVTVRPIDVVRRGSEPLIPADLANIDRRFGCVIDPQPTMYPKSVAAEFRSTIEPEFLCVMVLEPGQRRSPAVGAYCHRLKIWPEFMDAIGRGEKTFDARKNDRDFKVGDLLDMREWDPKTKEWGPRRILRQVTYILNGPKFGIKSGYCVMALAPVRKKRRAA